MLTRRFLTNSMIQRRWYTPYGSHVSDDDPIILEREKNNLLKGNVKTVLKTAPGWSEMLASDSEAMIKAEREPEPLSLKSLQLESVDILLSLYGNVKVVEQIKKEVKIEQTEENVVTINVRK